MTPRSVTSATLAVLLLAAAAPATAQTIAASGRVVLADGTPVAGTEVRAEVHDGRAIVFSETARADSDGSVSWAAIPSASGYHLQLSVRYADVDYFSETVPLSTNPVELTVTVHPVTAEGRPLHLDTLHLIVQVDEPGLFRVLQFMAVSNAGAAAYAGGPQLADGRRAGIVLPLPIAASSVQPAPFPSPDEALDAQRAEFGRDRVLDPRPVPPEGRQVAITYDLSSDGEPVPVVLTLPYPTQSVSLLVGGAAAEQIVVSDTSLEARPAEQIGEQEYELWGAEVLAPGTEITFTLGPPRVTVSTPAWALIGLSVALSLAVAGSFLHADPANRASLRRAILQRVADLDDDFDGDAISEAEYFRLRGVEIECLMLLHAHDPTEDN